MSGVGQTALDVLLGGRYWYQKVDVTLNIAGTIGVDVSDLQLSVDRSKALATSGGVSWVDPFVGLRVRQRLAPPYGIRAKGPPPRGADGEGDNEYTGIPSRCLMAT